MDMELVPDADTAIKRVRRPAYTDRLRRFTAPMPLQTYYVVDLTLVLTKNKPISSQIDLPAPRRFGNRGDAAAFAARGATPNGISAFRP
jgi:hypothetical protein